MRTAEIARMSNGVNWLYDKFACASLIWRIKELLGMMPISSHRFRYWIFWFGLKICVLILSSSKRIQITSTITWERNNCYYIVLHSFVKNGILKKHTLYVPPKTVSQSESSEFSSFLARLFLLSFAARLTALERRRNLLWSLASSGWAVFGRTESSVRLRTRHSEDRRVISFFCVLSRIRGSSPGRVCRYFAFCVCLTLKRYARYIKTMPFLSLYFSKMTCARTISNLSYTLAAYL